MNIMLLYLAPFINSTGGAEKVCCDMANEMVKRGHSVSIVYAYGKSGRPFFPLNENVRMYNLMSVSPEKWNGAMEFSIPRSWKIGRETLRIFNTSWAHGLEEEYVGRKIADDLKGLVEKEDADVIVSYWPRYSNYLLNYAKISKPLVTMFHFDPEILAKDASPGSRRACEYSKAVSVLLPKGVDRLHRYIPYANAVWMPNVVPQYEASAQLDMKKETYTVINVARLDKHQKRQHLLLKAFAKVAPQFPNWNLELWGQSWSGRYTEQLKSIITVHHLENRIFLKGTTQQVFKQYQQADIFAFPSAYEGFPLAMTEAMSAGLPVVAYRSCTAAEEIVQPDSGVLVDDGIEALADGLAKLMKSQELRVSMGRAAKKSMKPFAPQHIWDQWNTLLMDAASSRLKQVNQIK